MNDVEWQELRALWQQKKTELPPDMQRFARRYGWGLWISNLIFWPFVLSNCGLAIWLLGPARAEHYQLDAYVLLAFTGLLSVWFFVTQLRTWPDPLETPSEMLARFQRSLRRGRVGSWVGVAVYIAFSLGVITQIAVRRGGLLALSHGMLARFLLGLVCFLLYLWAAERGARRRRAQIDRWRQE